MLFSLHLGRCCDSVRPTTGQEQPCPSAGRGGTGRRRWHARLSSCIAGFREYWLLLSAPFSERVINEAEFPWSRRELRMVPLDRVFHLGVLSDNQLFDWFPVECDLFSDGNNNVGPNYYFLSFIYQNVLF